MKNTEAVEQAKINLTIGCILRLKNSNGPMKRTQLFSPSESNNKNQMLALMNENWQNHVLNFLVIHKVLKKSQDGRASTYEVIRMDIIDGICDRHNQDDIRAILWPDDCVNSPDKLDFLGERQSEPNEIPKTLSKAHMLETDDIGTALLAALTTLINGQNSFSTSVLNEFHSIDEIIIRKEACAETSLNGIKKHILLLEETQKHNYALITKSHTDIRAAVTEMQLKHEKIMSQTENVVTAASAISKISSQIENLNNNINGFRSEIKAVLDTRNRSKLDKAIEAIKELEKVRDDVNAAVDIVAENLKTESKTNDIR